MQKHKDQFEKERYSCNTYLILNALKQFQNYYIKHESNNHGQHKTFNVKYTK